MRDLALSSHAVERFIERFAGNLSWSAATERLRRLLLRARFAGMCAGMARRYTLRDMVFVVQQGILVTVYRRSHHARVGEWSVQ